MRIRISKSAFLPVASAFILLFLQVPSRAGIFLKTDYVLSQSGQGDTVPGNGQHTLTASGSGGPPALLSDGLALSLVDASVAALGGLYGPGDLRLGTYAGGLAHSYINSISDQGISIFQAFAQAHWTDDFIVSGQADMPLPPSVTMVVNFDGTLTRANSLAQLGDFTTGGSVQIEDQTSGTLTLTLGLSEDGRGRFFLDLMSSASGSASLSSSDTFPFSVGETVESISDFSHTLKIRSILMDDGSGVLVAPESLGYTLSFDSGMRSPNVAAVPEPSSVALALSGAAGLGRWRWRRHRGRSLFAA